MTSNSTLQTVTRIALIGFLTLVSVVNTFAQDSIVYHNEVINRLKQNKKEGVWKLFAPEDSIYLVCQFNNDTIVGDINIFKSNSLIFTIVKIRENDMNILIPSLVISIYSNQIPLFSR